MMRLALIAIGFVVLTSGVSSADEPARPKRPDTPANRKPAEVTFTSRIVPANAKPGDVVAYEVTATVAKPWHIYAYAEKQPDKGPRSTQFDLFQTSGLKPNADWKPSSPPDAKVEPVFDNAVFRSHEGVITWSLPIVVPKDATPGEKTLDSQVYFQICRDRVCANPTRSTVPAATLTVIANDR
jgi:hypothetical protein